MPRRFASKATRGALLMRSIAVVAGPSPRAGIACARLGSALLLSLLGCMKEILLVEDDDDLRELLAHMAERAGYRVREARNGAEALQDLATAPAAPALVLLDLMMPVMSGAEFLRALEAARAPSPPVVVLSAIADRQRPPGALAYLQKPSSEREFLRILETYAG